MARNRSKLKKRLLVRAFAIALLIPAAFFGLIYYEFFWKHRDCIRENLAGGGNGCYVPEVGTVYSGNSEVAIYLAIPFLVLAIGVWFSARLIR